MEDAPLYLPADIITIASERPLRMAAITPEPKPPAEPLISNVRPHGTAIAPYSSPLSFDWRKDVPAPAQPRKV